MKFIIWDPKDGWPRWSGDTGDCLSSGLVGAIGSENVYLVSYAKYPDEKRPRDLAVGGAICGVVFSLSGGRGEYDIVRVA